MSCRDGLGKTVSKKDFLLSRRNILEMLCRFCLVKLSGTFALC